MESELEIIKRKMLKEMLLKEGATKREATCPYDANGNTITFHKNLAKCKLAIADFWAEWCAPCRLIEPIFESLAEKYKGKAAFLRVNVDENPDLAAEYQVMSIPTLIVFSRGKEFTRFIGYSPQLSRQIENVLQRLFYS